LATQRLTARERIQAAELIAKLEAATEPMDLDSVLSLDRQVHRFIYKAAKNAYLFGTLDHYHNLSLRILYFAVDRFPSLLPSLDKVLHEQVSLLKAVCDGDADTAERIAMHHVSSFEVEARKVL
jgi:DNA-binding GntR family transcriptional regulator